MTALLKLIDFLEPPEIRQKYKQGEQNPFLQLFCPELRAVFKDDLRCFQYILCYLSFGGPGSAQESTISAQTAIAHAARKYLFM